MKENQSNMWLCINFIIDQAMMENYKFVWHVPDSDTYVIYIFVIKKKCSDSRGVDSILNPGGLVVV